MSAERRGAQVDLISNPARSRDTCVHDLAVNGTLGFADLLLVIPDHPDKGGHFFCFEAGARAVIHDFWRRARRCLVGGGPPKTLGTASRHDLRHAHSLLSIDWSLVARGRSSGNLAQRGTTFGDTTPFRMPCQERAPKQRGVYTTPVTK